MAADWLYEVELDKGLGTGGRGDLFKDENKTSQHKVISRAVYKTGSRELPSGNKRLCRTTAIPAASEKQSGNKATQRL